MPLHRHRVYFDYASSRRARIEYWFSVSIYLSAGILILSLLGSLPDVVSVYLLMPVRPHWLSGGMILRATTVSRWRLSQS